MTIPDDIRAMIAASGVLVTYTPAGGTAVPDVPVMIQDQPEGAQITGRPARVAQIRVSKQDVAALHYRDIFTEADGTVWTVFDASRIINDRSAGTWRVMVSTGERGK